MVSIGSIATKVISRVVDHVARMQVMMGDEVARYTR